MLKITRIYCAVFTGVLGFFCFVTGASGQNVDAARQRSADVQPQIEPQSLPLGVNVNQLPVSTAGDSDLGVQMIMKRQEREPQFRFFADVAGFYTDNVALTKTGKQPDSYLFADVGFTYERRLTDEWTVESTIRQGFFRYSEFEALDFDDFNIGAGVTYQCKKLWDLAFFGRYNFERFTDGDVSNDFFRNSSVTLGLQKTVVFGDSHYFYVGYSSVFGWAAPTSSERDEHGIFAGIHYNITRKLYAELYYRGAVFAYSSGRTDFNQTVVTTLGYTFNDYARLTASFSYASSRSNHSVFDYDALTTGGGVALQLRF